MCGEDGTQRGIYKLKEEHEERGDRNRKRKERKTQTERKRAKVEKKNCIDH